MSFEDAHELARKDTFQYRVLIALLRAASNVASETVASSGGDYDRYVKRAELATRVLNDPDQHRQPWAWVIASQPAITEESSDGDIEWTVNASWDNVAGVIEPAP